LLTKKKRKPLALSHKRKEDDGMGRKSQGEQRKYIQVNNHEASKQVSKGKGKTLQLWERKSFAGEGKSEKKPT